MIIPAGYRVSFTSWENDADNYKTEVIEGLSKDDAKFLVDIAKNFSSENNPKQKYTKSGYLALGNGTPKVSDLITIVANAYRKYPGISENLYSSYQIDDVLEYLQKIKSGELDEDTFDNDEDEDGIEFEFPISDILSYPSDWYDGNFMRVMESFEVTYTPIEIKLSDVTSEF